jgi:hypothetical protein
MRVGQRAQVVGHLLDGDAAFHVARQRAEHLRVVGAAQQVEQGLVVVLAGDLQRPIGGASSSRSNSAGIEALTQHGVVGQLVDHAGVRSR